MRQWIGSVFGSDNGLSPIRRQAIIWTNAELLSIGPIGTNFNEILIKIQNFSLKKTHLKMASVKWRPFCPGRDELILRVPVPFYMASDLIHLVFNVSSEYKVCHPDDLYVTVQTIDSTCGYHFFNTCLTINLSLMTTLIHHL